LPSSKLAVESHGTLLVAVHGQQVGPVTLNEYEPEAAPTDALYEDSEKEHGEVSTGFRYCEIDGYTRSRRE
jgi:hypothetical protein